MSKAASDGLYKVPTGERFVVMTVSEADGVFDDPLCPVPVGATLVIEKGAEPEEGELVVLRNEEFQEGAVITRHADPATVGDARWSLIGVVRQVSYIPRQARGQHREGMRRFALQLRGKDILIIDRHSEPPRTVEIYPDGARDDEAALGAKQQCDMYNGGWRPHIK